MNFKKLFKSNSKDKLNQLNKEQTSSNAVTVSNGKDINADDDDVRLSDVPSQSKPTTQSNKKLVKTQISETLSSEDSQQSDSTQSSQTTASTNSTATSIQRPAATQKKVVIQSDIETTASTSSSENSHGSKTFKNDSKAVLSSVESTPSASSQSDQSDSTVSSQVTESTKASTQSGYSDLKFVNRKADMAKKKLQENDKDSKKKVVKKDDEKSKKKDKSKQQSDSKEMPGIDEIVKSPDVKNIEIPQDKPISISDINIDLKVNNQADDEMEQIKNMITERTKTLTIEREQNALKSRSQSFDVSSQTNVGDDLKKIREEMFQTKSSVFGSTDGKSDQNDDGTEWQLVKSKKQIKAEKRSSIASQSSIRSEKSSIPESLRKSQLQKSTANSKKVMPQRVTTLKSPASSESSQDQSLNQKEKLKVKSSLLASESSQGSYSTATSDFTSSSSSPQSESFVQKSRKSGGKNKNQNANLPRKALGQQQLSPKQKQFKQERVEQWRQQIEPLSADYDSEDKPLNLVMNNALQQNQFHNNVGYNSIYQQQPNYNMQMAQSIQFVANQKQQFMMGQPNAYQQNYGQYRRQSDSSPSVLSALDDLTPYDSISNGPEIRKLQAAHAAQANQINNQVNPTLNQYAANQGYGVQPYAQMQFAQPMAGNTIQMNQQIMQPTMNPLIQQQAMNPLVQQQMQMQMMALQQQQLQQQQQQQQMQRSAFMMNQQLKNQGRPSNVQAPSWLIAEQPVIGGNNTLMDAVIKGKETPNAQRDLVSQIKSDKRSSQTPLMRKNQGQQYFPQTPMNQIQPQMQSGAYFGQQGMNVIPQQQQILQNGQQMNYGVPYPQNPLNAYDEDVPLSNIQYRR